MKLALGYCFDAYDLFENFNLKKIRFAQKDTYQYFHDGSKIRFVHFAFVKVLKYIVNDVIDNDVEFLFPGRSNFSLYVKRYAGEDFKVLRRLGAFSLVDFLLSNFSALALIIHRKNRNIRDTTIRVYLAGEEKEKINKNTANQVVYYLKTQKKIADYKDIIQQMFPSLNISDLVYIVRYGFDLIYRHIQYGGDIRLISRDFTFLAGKLTVDPLKHKAYYQTKLATKIGVLYNRRKKPTDEYYYFKWPKSQELDEIAKVKLYKHELVCDLNAATNKIYKVLRVDINEDGTVPAKKAIFVRNGTNFTMKDLEKINNTIWQDKRR